MNKLIRLYNQNRALVISVIAVIALIIIIIQVLNSLVKAQNEEKRANIANDRNSSTNLESTTISPSNKSVITGQKVNTNEEDKEVIKTFIEYCNNREIEKAYNLLSSECKNRIYPTVDSFKSGYIDRIFYIDRMFTLENWYSSSKLTTYHIKYTEDILASGNANSSNNISDYITVMRTNDTIYLNINNFIGSEDINKSLTKNGITIELNKLYMYMDYTIANLKIKNNSEKTILLDTKKDVKTMYLYDTNAVKYIAFLNEIAEENLKVRKNMEKNLDIKFDKIYNPKNRTLNRNCFRRCSFKL